MKPCSTFRIPNVGTRFVAEKTWQKVGFVLFAHTQQAEILYRNPLAKAA